jgi:hypothetical protein
MLAGPVPELTAVNQLFICGGLCALVLCLAALLYPLTGLLG